MLIHENDNYMVIADLLAEFNINGVQYDGGYLVRNKTTRVVEFKTPALPEALFTSEQLNHALVNKAWEWRSKEKKPTQAEAVLQ